MIKRRICCILGVALLVFPALSSSAQEEGAGVTTRDEFVRRFLASYVTTLYNTSTNGFPSDEANAVLQTRDGYMWFGGYNGLVRYDGKQFRLWDALSPNGFGSSNVRSLLEGRDGTLWIGTNDKGLVAYKNGVFAIYDRAMGSPSNTIRDIAEAPDGRIFCGTPDGIFYIDGERRITTFALDTLIQPFVVSVSCDDQNNVYAVLNSGELFAYTSDGRTVQYPAATRIRRAEFVSRGRIVAGTQDGRIIVTGFRGGAFTGSRIGQTPMINIASIYEDSRGLIWISSETGIGFLDTSGNFCNAGNPNGVGFYTGICEDYQNGYWITGSQGGIVKLTLSAFSSLNTLFQFETGPANAVLRDNGKTYIGTDTGLFILGEDGRPALRDLSGPVTSRVRGIFRDSAGHIWICTYSGLIRYTPETQARRTWRPADGLASERTRCMVELPSGVVVIGTTAGVSFFKGDSIISAEEAFGTDRPVHLPLITVLSLVCTSDGTLYIGTDGNGIYAVNRNGTTRYTELDGLAGGVILRMLVNKKTDGVWVSSSRGLCYISENKTVRMIDKVPPMSFFDILQHKNELVLLTSSTVIRTDADALLDPALPFEHVALGRSSGLISSINANSWNLITEDGDLYFCCESGVNIYSAETGIAPFIPYAGIARIDVDGREHGDFSGKIVMPRHTERLTIELSYLSFGFLDDATLRYTLIGQDREARSVSKADTLSFQVSYTNLKGGSYTLQVWTENTAGDRGNFIAVEFQKELQLFEHAFVWVIIAGLAVLFIVLLIAAIVRFKSIKHYEKQREYRTIISQALSAIANTIDAKDSYTSGHSVRTAAYSVEIARWMGMGKDFVENLYYIGLLHDVGKIGIPNEIINKPAKLTKEEFDVMKQHSRIGKEILKDITTINNLTAGAAEHHEHWDGSGYNQGISGEAISLEGRIIGIADTYDAMSSDRSYRKGLPKERIIEEFKRYKGTQFDPKIAEVIIAMLEQDHFSTIDVKKVIDIHDESPRP